jgi:gluconate 2-dehydrogenase gamma chain
MTFISRRDLLKRAAAVGGAAVVAGSAEANRPADASGAGDGLLVQVTREPLEHLTAAEADILEAVVARLIPTDANGPGATEARAARYIDRALGGALASSRQAYSAGLAAVDRHARASRGKAFTELPPGDQDAVLTDVENGTAAGFSGSPTAFFNLVLNHTQQGTFGDPYYGGNANFVGWDLIAYPGIRTMVSSGEQQQLEQHALKKTRKSAYDSDAFTRASAKNLSRRSPRGEGA